MKVLTDFVQKDNIAILPFYHAVPEVLKDFSTTYPYVQFEMILGND